MLNNGLPQSQQIYSLSELQEYPQQETYLMHSMESIPKQEDEATIRRKRSNKYYRDKESMQVEPGMQITRTMRARYWSSEEELKLCEIWFQYLPEIMGSNFRKSGDPIFYTISKIIKSRGVYLNAQDCRRRIFVHMNKYK